MSGTFAGCTRLSGFREGGSAPETDWPAFQYGGGRSGYHPRAVGPKRNVGERWRVESRYWTPRTPVVRGDSVYAAGYDDLRSFDRETGAENWRYRPERRGFFGAAASNPPASVTRPENGPLVTDDAVYCQFQSFDAVDADRGERRWVADVGDAEFPALADGSLHLFVAGSEATGVRAVDPVDGTVRRTHWIRRRLGAGTATDGRLFAYATFDRRNTLPEHRTWHVAAFSLDDGEERWRWEGVESEGADVPPPTVVDGVVYAAAVDGDRHTAVALDAIEGRERWRLGRVREYVSPAVADGVVYLGRRSSGSAPVDVLTAVDAADGSVRWETPLHGWLASHPVVADGVVYCRTAAEVRGGFVYALDARDGTERWRYAVDRSTRLTAPAVSGGVVYVSTGAALLALGGRP